MDSRQGRDCLRMNTGCCVRLEAEGQREARERCRWPELRCGSGHGQEGRFETSLGGEVSRIWCSW